MTFLQTPEGQDFYRLFNAMGDIDVTHTMYMMEVLEFMRMMQLYDDTNKTPEQEMQAQILIKQQAKSMRNRSPYVTLTILAPEYDYEFLPALIDKWAQQ